MMEMNRKTVYEAPEVSIVALGQQCVICAGSPGGGNGLTDYGYGGLDESSVMHGFTGFGQ